MCFLLVALISGCGSGNSDPAAQTELPDTPFIVSLYGPDSKGHYHYTVADRSSVLIDRFLGPAQVNKPSKSNIFDEGQGRYRITWGPGRGEAFTLIDTETRRIVVDTNSANPSNQSF